MGVDLCTFNGKQRFITVGYCSNFWEVDALIKNQVSQWQTEGLFVRHGVPDTVFTDTVIQGDYARGISDLKEQEVLMSQQIQRPEKSPQGLSQNGERETEVLTLQVPGGARPLPHPGPSLPIPSHPVPPLLIGVAL